jgi:hypothetical protein
MVISDFVLASVAMSLLFLIFAPSPFGVLIYSQYALSVTTWDDWMALTFILLTGQIGYAIWRENRRTRD